MVDWLIRNGDKKAIQLRWESDALHVVRSFPDEGPERLLARYEEQKHLPMDVYDPRSGLREVSLGEDVWTTDLWLSQFVQDARLDGIVGAEVDVEGLDWTEELGEAEPGVVY